MPRAAPVTSATLPAKGVLPEESIDWVTSRRGGFGDRYERAREARRAFTMACASRTQYSLMSAQLSAA